MTTLRIIAGKWRSRLIRFPAAPDLRPTPDRVRETLFNWLGQDLTGQHTLEPYAGSGALSFEALSRGAAHAVLWDQNKEVVATLKNTARTLDTAQAEIRQADALAALSEERRRFDLIFLDPPFARDDWAFLLPTCAALLNEGGFLYVEASRFIEAYPPELTRLKQGRAGVAHFGLYKRAQK
ncbi:MAG: 16S rRNA (guanine(966)-N(2))-methyltransferase RsmD [Burkholderiales bacterium]|nr:16S rRNA (guanine(966)-N(2))-methyltransferase RsmD [Burkholderiales bacterium]